MGKWREILEDFPPSSFLSISLCHACRQEEEEEEEEPLLRAVNYYPPLSPSQVHGQISRLSANRPPPPPPPPIKMAPGTQTPQKKRARRERGCLELEKKPVIDLFSERFFLPSRLFFWQKKPCVPLTLAPPSILFGRRKGGQEGKEGGGQLLQQLLSLIRRLSRAFLLPFFARFFSPASLGGDFEI